jgi:hypothetical protein
MDGRFDQVLRKVLGCSQVDAEGLCTVLTRIEVAMNSRTIIQDDNNKTLTPSYFFNGGKLTTLPDGPEPTGMKMLTKSFRQSQKLTQDLWRRWQKENLLQLRKYHEVRKQPQRGPKFKVGDTVLLQEEKQPRHMWKKAKIEELSRKRQPDPNCYPLTTRHNENQSSSAAGHSFGDWPGWIGCEELRHLSPFNSLTYVKVSCSTNSCVIFTR